MIGGEPRPGRARPTTGRKMYAVQNKPWLLMTDLPSAIPTRHNSPHRQHTAKKAGRRIATRTGCDDNSAHDVQGCLSLPPARFTSPRKRTSYSSLVNTRRRHPRRDRGASPIGADFSGAVVSICLPDATGRPEFIEHSEIR